MTDGYFTLGRDDLHVADDVTAASAEFAESNALVCHGALAPDLVRRLDATCDAAAFRSDHVTGLGHRRVETPALAGTTLGLLLRRPALHRWLECVTGCAPIATVEGRVVQTYAEPGDELAWHDDVDARRVLAVTIALGSPAYRGGEFEQRTVGTHRPLLRYVHDRPGTAVIFGVSPAFEHRVLPLLSGGPRRVFTGWFLRA